MKQFFKDAFYELSQVTWLTRSQAIRISAITVVFVILSAVGLWAVDSVFTEIYKVL